MSELCRWKNVHIISAEICSNHVHMFVEIPPKMSVSQFMCFLKVKSSIMIYEKCHESVWKNEIAIKNYIENQLKEDHMSEQLTLDKMDLFTGSWK